MFDKSSIFLFPETIQTNPFLFSGKAVQASTDGVKVNGFKLYCLIDNLNLNQTPFTVVAVRSQGSVSTFYQYNFPNQVPDFRSLGFDSVSTPNGQILFMTEQNFIKATVNTRYEKIKSGNWADVSKLFYEITSYYQLDVVPQLSFSIFKNEEEQVNCDKKFHELYDVQEAQKVTIYSLFNDISNLLCFFGFMKTKLICNENYCSFAPLREPFRAFLSQCFDYMFTNDTTITPGAVKQLRALFNFVKLSLAKVGYESVPSDDVYYATTVAMNRFQRENGIKDSYCSQETIKCLLASVLMKEKDPSIALQGTGIDISIDKTDKDYFGAIDSTNMDEVAKKFATGVSRAVSKLTSPAVYITEIENEMLQIAISGTDSIEKVNDMSESIDDKIADVKRMATNVQEEATKSLKNAEAAEKSLTKLENIGSEIEERLETVKTNLETEMSKSNKLIIILILLISIFIWQRLGSKPIKIPSINMNEKIVKLSQNEQKLP